MNTACSLPSERCHGFELDASLSTDDIRAAFRERGRLSILGILRAANVQRLYDDLCVSVPWNLTFGGSSQDRVTIEHEDVARLSTFQKRAIFELAYSGGGLRGAHLFASSTYHSATMTEFSIFLNSPTFLEFLRNSTELEIRRVMTSASRFTAGHFYGFHRDNFDDAKQVGTIVFYLTPHWSHQWGGLLQFRNDDGDIDDVIFPRFNSMTIMRSDLAHAVSYVAPYAGQDRYTIGGKLLA